MTVIPYRKHTVTIHVSQANYQENSKSDYVKTHYTLLSYLMSQVLFQRVS